MKNETHVLKLARLTDAAADATKTLADLTRALAALARAANAAPPRRR